MVVIDNTKSAIVFTHIESIGRALSFPFGLSEFETMEFDALSKDDTFQFYVSNGTFVVKQPEFDWSTFTEDNMTKTQLYEYALNEHGVTLKRNKSFDNMLADLKTAKELL